MSYKSIAEVKAAHESTGGKFFSKVFMKKVDSKISKTLYGGKYFVTSEVNCKRRKYTVRVAGANGVIDNVGEILAYSSMKDAVAKIKRLLK